MKAPILTHFYLERANKYFLPEITYYPNGQIKSERFFTDGEKLIKEKRYKEDGSLAEIVNYISDGSNNVLYFDRSEIEKRSGMALTYYENGKVQSQKYYVEGKIHWQEKIFNDSGHLIEFISYEKGGKKGPFIMYNDKGNKIKEINYEDNIPSGQAKFYYDNGMLKAEVNYKDGKKNGITKVYYENGVLNIQENIVDDVREGITTTYYESGGLKEEWQFTKGSPEGKSKFYYSSGALYGTKDYRAGKEEGLTQLYYENGTLKEEINYMEGKKHGKNKIYDSNGNLVKELVFADGVFEKENEPPPIVEVPKPLHRNQEQKMTFREKTILTFNYFIVIAGIIFVIYLIYFYLIASIL